MLLVSACILAGVAAVLAVLHVRGGAVYDTIIRDALIYDGLGGKPYEGSVAISGGRIRAIWRAEPFLRPGARVEIDAKGSALAPGFIDTHSHADFAIADGTAPIRADNFLMQGVTTMIVGNCGRLSHPVPLLARLVDKRGTNVNIATLIGLNSVRESVMHVSPYAADPAQIASMCEIVRRGMDAGAVGVSTGYAYVPGRFASPSEIVAELAVAREYDGVHATHVRDEAANVLAAVGEAMAASRAARIPLLVSHLKIAGHSNCGAFAELRRRFAEYEREIGPVVVDQYPWDAQSTGLDLYLPDEFLRQSEHQQAAAIVAHPEEVKRLIAARLAADGYRDFSFARVASYIPRPDWRGLTVDEIDRRWHRTTTSTLSTQLDVVLEMLRHGGAQMIYHNLCDDVLDEVQRDPATFLCMFGSDSTIRFNDGKTFPHPRGWNTFPRVFRELVYHRHLLSTEMAVQRMTDVPARFFGLEDRGRIAVGYIADLVLFDPEKLDGADFRDPYRRPAGIRWVFVNGVAEVAEQTRGLFAKSVEVATTGDTAGAFIRRDRRLRRSADGLLRTSRIPANDEVEPAQPSLWSRITRREELLGRLRDLSYASAIPTSTRQQKHPAAAEGQGHDPARSID